MVCPYCGAHPCAGKLVSCVLGVCAAVEGQVVGGRSFVMRWGTVVRNETVSRITLGLGVARDYSCPRHWQTANPVPETGQDSREAWISRPIHSPRHAQGLYSIGRVRFPEQYWRDKGK